MPPTVNYLRAPVTASVSLHPDDFFDAPTGDRAPHPRPTPDASFQVQYLVIEHGVLALNGPRRLRDGSLGIRVADRAVADADVDDLPPAARQVARALLAAQSKATAAERSALDGLRFAVQP